MDEIFVGQSGMQKLEGSFIFEIYMFSQVDFGKSTLAEQREYLIVTYLLSHSICHNQSPCFCRRCSLCALIWGCNTCQGACYQHCSRARKVCQASRSLYSHQMVFW